MQSKKNSTKRLRYLNPKYQYLKYWKHRALIGQDLSVTVDQLEDIRDMYRFHVNFKGIPVGICNVIGLFNYKNPDKTIYPSKFMRALWPYRDKVFMGNTTSFTVSTHWWDLEDSSATDRLRALDKSIKDLRYIM